MASTVLWAAWQDLEKTLEPLLFYYKAARRADEGFGDFCSRAGFPALESYAASYISPTASESLPKVRVGGSETPCLL